jgi:Flp pilus assembly protein TadD
MKLFRKDRRLLTLVSLTYVFILGAFLLASFFPDNRVWGINWWGYFPAFVPVGLFLLGLVSLPLTRWYFAKKKSDLSDPNPARENRLFWIIGLATIGFCGVSFWLFRLETHFLGDGYSLLGSLSEELPKIKTRNYGASLILIWIKELLGEGRPAALLSFRLVSLGSGLLFLVGLFFSARHLFERLTDRLLFFFSVATGGYLLLFFGYVENYPLFAATVGIFAMLGMAVATRRLSRWFVIPVLAFALFLHIFGVVLIPAACFLMLANTRFSQKVARLSRNTLLMLWFFVTLILVAVYFYLYNNSYEFQYAVVPLIANQFTAAGYTLFSASHLFDFANLLLLFSPGLPLALLLLFQLPKKTWRKSSEINFLLLISGTLLASVFLIDPKIGMARDWDLFAFAGLPLVMLIAYLLVTYCERIRLAQPGMVLFILLGLYSIAPRVASQNQPEIAIAHFENYLQLDRIKNMNSWFALINFYQQHDQATKAQARYQRFDTEFRENMMSRQSRKLFREGQRERAIALAYQIVSRNPLFHAAYANLGYFYLELDRIDSAICYLEKANAMNAYHATILGNLGGAYYRKGKYRAAEKAYQKSIASDSSVLASLSSLVILYNKSGENDKAQECLSTLMRRKEIESRFVIPIGTDALADGRFQQAAEAFRLAFQIDQDTTFIREQVAGHPQLRQWLTDLL